MEQDGFLLMSFLKRSDNAYCEANKDYLQKQIRIASEYLTDEQKEELRQKGILT